MGQCWVTFWLLLNHFWKTRFLNRCYRGFFKGGEKAGPTRASRSCKAGSKRASGFLFAVFPCFVPFLLNNYPKKEKKSEKNKKNKHVVPKDKIGSYS